MTSTSQPRVNILLFFRYTRYIFLNVKANRTNTMEILLNCLREKFNQRAIRVKGKSTNYAPIRLNFTEKAYKNEAYTYNASNKIISKILPAPRKYIHYKNRGIEMELEFSNDAVFPRETKKKKRIEEREEGGGR